MKNIKNLKRTYTVLFVAAILMFTSCGISNSNVTSPITESLYATSDINIETTESRTEETTTIGTTKTSIEKITATENEITSTTVPTTVVETKTVSFDLFPLDKKLLPVMQAFREVLLNETQIYCADGFGYDKDKQYFYLSELCSGNGLVSYPNFTIVDLDGDGVPELVLSGKHFFTDYLYLRYNDGKVMGYADSNKSAGLCNKNGVVIQTYGASDFQYGKFLFSGDTKFFYCIAGCNWNYSDLNEYYFASSIINGGKNIDETEFNAFRDSLNNLNQCVWHEYSEDSINEWLIINPEPIAPSLLKEEAYAEKQNHLDSIAYLIDLKYVPIRNCSKIT